MSDNLQYRLEYKKLEKGLNKLNYQIDDKFFELFEYSELTSGKINVEANLEFSGNLIIIEFLLNGFIYTECDVCLETFPLDISNEFNLVFKFSEDNSNDDEIIYVSENEVYIDLSKHFYDYIILSLPIKKVHPSDENGNRVCDSKILEQLDNLAPAEKLNNSPEWEKLKSLYNK